MTVVDTNMKRPAAKARALWLIPLGLVVIAFLAYALPPYLTFDPSHSRIPPPRQYAVYYTVLVLHVVCGATAMASGALQIWTGAKGLFPSLHRITGRIYLFCGVLPAGMLALGLTAMSPFGPVLIASDFTLATLWLIATLTGYRMIRRGRMLDHRRWMVRSYVLTLSIITNRLWVPVAAIILMPQLATTFHGDEAMMWQIIPGLSGWMGWVLPIIGAEWLLVDRLWRAPAAFADPRPAP